MWGIFPTQFLSLNPILLSESKNSKNSGIFWNLWNLSANMTYLSVLPKWGTFPTQIKAPEPILMSKSWNLQNLTDLESWFQWFQNKFQIAQNFFDIRIRSGTSIWVGKVSCLGKTDKFWVFVERFHRFQKLPEFLEFFDSDSRIRFSDKNWVGKTPHIVILAKNGRIMSQIGNQLIKISWNQLIFYSDQSWSKTAKSEGKSEIGWLKSAEISWFF